MNSNPAATELTVSAVNLMSVTQLTDNAAEKQMGHSESELSSVNDITGDNHMGTLTEETEDSNTHNFENPEDFLKMVSNEFPEPSQATAHVSTTRSEPPLLTQFRQFFKCAQTKRLLGEVKNEKYRRVTLEKKVLPKLELFYGNSKELLVRDMLKTDRFQEVVQQFVVRELEELLKKLEKDMSTALRQRDTTSKKEVVEDVEEMLRNRSQQLLKSISAKRPIYVNPPVAETFETTPTEIQPTLFESQPSPTSSGSIPTPRKDGTLPRPVPKALCSEEVMRIVVQEVLKAGGGSVVDKRKWSEIARLVAEQLPDESPGQKRLRLTDKGVIVKEVYLNSILLTEQQMVKIEELVDQLGGINEVDEKENIWRDLCTKLEISGDDSPYLVRQWFKRRHGPSGSEKVRKPRRKVIRLMKNEKESRTSRGQKQDFPTSPTSSNVIGNISFSNANNNNTVINLVPTGSHHTILGHHHHHHHQHEDTDSVTTMQFGTLHHATLGQIGGPLPTLIHPMVNLSGIPMNGNVNHIGMTLNTQMDN